MKDGFRALQEEVTEVQMPESTNEPWETDRGQHCCHVMTGQTIEKLQLQDAPEHTTEQGEGDCVLE